MICISSPKIRLTLTQPGATVCRVYAGFHSDCLFLICSCLSICMCFLKLLFVCPCQPLYPSFFLQTSNNVITLETLCPHLCLKLTYQFLVGWKSAYSLHFGAHLPTVSMLLTTIVMLLMNFPLIYVSSFNKTDISKTHTSLFDWCS